MEEAGLDAIGKLVEVYGVGALGTICLATAFLWVMIKYLPQRDREAMELHHSYAESMKAQAREYKAATDQLVKSLERQQDKFLEEYRDVRRRD